MFVSNNVRRINIRDMAILRLLSWHFPARTKGQPQNSFVRTVSPKLVSELDTFPFTCKSDYYHCQNMLGVILQNNQQFPLQILIMAGT
jgi:hypothetical protein